VRIFVYFAAILFAVILMAGCKKDVAVTPAARQTIKLATVDSTSLNGGDKGNPIKPPQR